MIIKLPDPASGNVISLELVRASHYTDPCTHKNVIIRTGLTTISCKDCSKDLNPIEYVAQLVEQWGYVQRLYEDYRVAKAAYEGKARCRCEHCGKLTRVQPKLSKTQAVSYMRHKDAPA